MEKKRCAIYCRKSVEDREEKDFNSIDAQREAAENYIASQRGNGWICLPERYDDYGFSGGNVNRPALQKLMADVDAGLIDLIVFYKLDRFSRSIADFAELSRKLDARGVSFASVTQEINTSTSAGRMMLNILMTFASFEREQIAERIKDKMSASRKKGMWVGGSVAPGYKVVDKKLVIEPTEAETVRRVFQRYIETQSPKLIASELNAAGIKTRRGNQWDKGHIYRMLNNYTYLGEVDYHGTVYPGEHEGIIDHAIWDRVHELLKLDDPVKEPKGRVAIVASLKGILRCGHCGGAMMPSYGKKDGKIYHYYLCARDTKRAESICPVKRLPAGDIEKIVFEQVGRLFQTPEIVTAAAKSASVEPHEAAEIFEDLGECWNEMSPGERNRLLRLLVAKAEVSDTGLELEIRTSGVTSLIAEMQNEQN